ncbi:uncharacterized protein N7469_003984 [Penicillium citrinum]|uniref:Uncharacterized protein n=1 Tax=Penicillium citrinum TaxID=5077 RepID=A0A9W9TQ40_PENCI|nr:uncharacterized protein N7469_003984 [Penicillium citrinum]KAJ5234816.1 hypothetical protein N7469_003984 [Penicillium citrinum]
METRLSCRKRRNSTVSDSLGELPVSRRTRQATATETISKTRPSEDVRSNFGKQERSTPRKSRKRVRFSDPGPFLHDTTACSTGLTPAMKRTSFGPSSAKVSRRGSQTPSRNTRRKSAPTPRSLRAFDQVEEYDECATQRIHQFTPLRQILDSRTQRRIRRFGLSDEVNQIEREKREDRKFEKSLSSLRQERDDLRRQLSLMQQRGEISDESLLASSESYWMSPQVHNPEVEPDAHVTHEQNPVTSRRDQGSLFQAASDGEGDTLNDSAIIVSKSPDYRAMLQYNTHTPEPDSLMYEEEDTIIHAATQTSFNGNTENSDIYRLTLDLEAARSEKEKLFSRCRSELATFGDASMRDILRLPSPPQDVCDNIASILTTALSRASAATEALEGINQECSNLGFSGANAEEVVFDIKNSLRSARLELERAIPGETADVGLEDGKATLSALVRRVRLLASDLQTEQKLHHGSLGREKALKGHFDDLLYRYEAAATKISKLEGSIASSASDMLHTRMRLQELENEDQEKTIGIDRLNTALDKYHDDMKSLESLVNRLEDENVAAKAYYRQQIAKLKKQVASERQQRSQTEASASEYETHIRLLEETVENNRIKVCDLMAQVESLEKEHRVASGVLESKSTEQLQQHECEMGTLNVRISELNTSLDEIKVEATRLRRVNAGLEEQLRIEIEARDELLDKWAAEQARSFAFMKESVNSERRRSKVRAANWELQSDDLMSDGTTIAGSEPITPVSMTRFVDVECGRGKDRRRMDSGVGLLTNEDILNDDVSDLRCELDSDIDLPTLDLIDA